VVLVYQEPATNRSEAGRREYEIKRLRREEKARLIAGRNRNAAPPG
jgi:predicted GIY-YIG superfamily endonuclease